MTYKPSPGHIVGFTLTSIGDIQGQILQPSDEADHWIVVDAVGVLYEQPTGSLYSLTGKLARAVKDQTDIVKMGRHFASELERFLHPPAVMPRYRVVFRDNNYCKNGDGPSPGGGYPEKWQVPLKLVDRDFHTRVGPDLSPEFLNYLSFWTGRRAALDFLAQHDERMPTVYTLCHEYEKPTRLVAQSLGCSHDTVERILRRARQLMGNFQRTWKELALEGFEDWRKAG